MVSINIMAICDVIALILTFLFVILAVGILISIIVSKVHKNQVKPIRIILLIVAAVCGVLSAAGCYAIDSKLSNDNESTVFTDIYDEENNIIVLDGVRYLATPVNDYRYFWGDDTGMEVVGEYTYDTDYYNNSSLSIARMTELLSDSLMGAVEDYDFAVTIFKYPDGEYDLIYDNWFCNVYCNEAQYEEYIQYCTDSANINCIDWLVFDYSETTEEDYDDDEGSVSEITEDIQKLISEFTMIYISDNVSAESIVTEETAEQEIYIDVYRTEDKDIYIEYSIYVIDGKYYLETDYDIDVVTYEVTSKCVELSDEWIEIINNMMELSDGE